MALSRFVSMSSRTLFFSALYPHLCCVVASTIILSKLRSLRKLEFNLTPMANKDVRNFAGRTAYDVASKNKHARLSALTRRGKVRSIQRLIEDERWYIEGTNKVWKAQEKRDIKMKEVSSKVQNV
ncbi:uncharacterized protein LOC114168634 [Vigna unguiculata]|uniref:uncharacterized protein LOC114168634 n=1 Tax=Vigna unguiculata TaxID=3917 RepID=UPI001016226B|nr:uncharacterized protein LOC114168634 [Vigna unguiculata]